MAANVSALTMATNIFGVDDANADFCLDGPVPDLLAAAADAFSARGVPPWAFDGLEGGRPIQRLLRAARHRPGMLRRPRLGVIIEAHLGETLAITRDLGVGQMERDLESVRLTDDAARREHMSASGGAGAAPAGDIRPDAPPPGGASRVDGRGPPGNAQPGGVAGRGR